MKHAIIIIAHNNIQHLKSLVEYFETECHVFIHIDKKCIVSQKEIDTILAMKQVVNVYRKYSVHWGGYSILKSELFLLKQAVKESDADYYHILSGQDYPIKPLRDFLTFFEKEEKKNYLSLVHLPHPLWQENTFSRFQYLYFYDWLKLSRKSHFVAKCVELQKKIGFCKSIPNHFNHLYGGSQWMSVTKHAVKQLLNYTNEKSSFLKRMRFIFAPDEIYIQTVLGNILDIKEINNNNLRYIRWHFENNSKPAILDCNHFHYLLESNAFFARKFSEGISDNIIHIINKYLIKDSKCTISKTGAWLYDGFLQYTFNHSLLRIIISYIKLTNLKDGIDFGCGIGLYVLNLRKNGFPIMGYDGNKNIGKLSRFIIPKNDIPCEYADLTDDFTDDIKYDLVICMDVLTYIPIDLIPKAIKNLFKLCNKSIIISIKKNAELEQTENILLEYLIPTFYYNHTMSKLFQKEANDNMLYYIFECNLYHKKSNPL